MAIKFKKTEKEKYTLIEFTVGKDCTPDLLEKTTLPKVDYKKGVVLKGEGPFWLFGLLIHNYHPKQWICRWIAIFDPSLKEAVVVASNDPSIEVGNSIDLIETDTV